MMRNWLLTVGGAVLAVVGVIWALQGFGTIGGSFMSGDSVFAIIGPVLAVVGLLLVVVGIRRARSA
jgi:Fe2+ transport system protein B